MQDGRSDRSLSALGCRVTDQTPVVTLREGATPLGSGPIAC